MRWFADELDAIGVVVGALLVLGGLGTLVGTPWVYSNSLVVSVGQVFGAVCAILIGAGLAWLVHTRA